MDAGLQGRGSREPREPPLPSSLRKCGEAIAAAVISAIGSPSSRVVEYRPQPLADLLRHVRRVTLQVDGGLIVGNPLPALRRGKRGGKRTHLPAALAKDSVGAILRAADKADVGKSVRRAHYMAVFTAQRIGEIVPATWDEIDLQSAVWSMPRDRMKRKDQERGPHLVPIPPRPLAMLKEWRHMDGEDSSYVCPSPAGHAPITRVSVEKFYRRTLKLSGKHSPHSWRSVLSTWANDAGEDADAVEAQLDHATGNKVKTLHDRAKRLERRADLMAWHEGALLAARDGAQVVQLATRKAAT